MHHSLITTIRYHLLQKHHINLKEQLKTLPGEDYSYPMCVRITVDWYLVESAVPKYHVLPG